MAQNFLEVVLKIFPNSICAHSFTERHGTESWQQSCMILLVVENACGIWKSMRGPRVIKNIDSVKYLMSIVDKWDVVRIEEKIAEQLCQKRKIKTTYDGDVDARNRCRSSFSHKIM